jgi:hypothetical protein
VTRVTRHADTKHHDIATATDGHYTISTPSSIPLTSLCCSRPGSQPTAPPRCRDERPPGRHHDPGRLATRQPRATTPGSPHHRWPLPAPLARHTSAQDDVRPIATSLSAQRAPGGPAAAYYRRLRTRRGATAGSIPWAHLQAPGRRVRAPHVQEMRPLRPRRAAPLPSYHYGPGRQNRAKWPAGRTADAAPPSIIPQGRSHSPDSPERTHRVPSRSGRAEPVRSAPPPPPTFQEANPEGGEASPSHGEPPGWREREARA